MKRNLGAPAGLIKSGASKSPRGCQIDVVGPIGNQLVAKRRLDLMVTQEKRSRHALHVSSRNQGEVTCQPRQQHSIDAFTVEILAQLGPRQSKSFVKLAVWIGETRKVVQFVGSKEFCRAFFTAQMHERDAGALGFNLGTKAPELGDRLAAEGSAKMPQENE